MSKLDIQSKKDILNIALTHMQSERAGIEEKLQKIKDKEYLFKGLYGPFKEDKEKLYHSRYYYTNKLKEIDKKIEDAHFWNSEIRTNAD